MYILFYRTFLVPIPGKFLNSARILNSVLCWVTQLFVYNEPLVKVKKAARLVCFGVVFEKVSGVFFQRAERKLEQTLPFTRCTRQETRNRRFTWKQRKIRMFRVPCSHRNSEDLNVTISKFLNSVRILRRKIRANHSECWLKYDKHSLKEALQAYFRIPWFRGTLPVSEYNFQIAEYNTANTALFPVNQVVDNLLCN